MDIPTKATEKPVANWMYFIGKWGKAESGHPLVYHLLDSAAVASLLWEKGLSPGSRALFAQWLASSEDEVGRLLAFWTSLHDLGKASPSFQSKHEPTTRLLKAKGFNFPNITKVDLVHHSLLSQWMLCDYEAQLNFPKRYFQQFRLAIGGHHGQFHFAEDDRTTATKGRLDNLGNAIWKDERTDMVNELLVVLKPPTLSSFRLRQTEQNAFFNLLTGFFITADWIASQDDLFQYTPAEYSLHAYWEEVARPKALEALQKTGWIGWHPDDRGTSFSEIFGFPPFPLQQVVMDVAEHLDGPFLMIIEAPTGMGKTEAALMAADRAIRTGQLRGCYVAMPTQATSNQMFNRFIKYLGKRYRDQSLINVQLVHGNALLNEEYEQMRLQAVFDEDGSDKDDGEEGRVNALNWFLPRKRTLLAPFGVGTVDQTFLSVLRVRHSVLRLFGLHRKVVIFDEVHAYDTYMQELFKRLLSWLRAVGSSVILLSATLPRQTRNELLQAYSATNDDEIPEVSFPRLSVNDGNTILVKSLGTLENRHILIQQMPRDPSEPIGNGVEEGWLNLLRGKLVDGGCAAIICNTVDRAQEIYEQIREAKIVNDDDLFLLHARMPFCQREKVEESILSKFGKLDESATAPRHGIVVATQIIEQSLDLDFDLLISDLAPIDLLIQRIGRLHRHTFQKFPPLRSSSLKEPICWILQPDNPGAGKLPVFPFEVYDEAILQRTYFALRPTQTLALPAASDTLINKVYSNLPLGECDEEQNSAITELMKEMLAEADQLVSNAYNHLVGDVDDESALGHQVAYLKEDDNEVGKATQALTRNVELPSVQLICFLRENGKLYLLDGKHLYDPGTHPTRLDEKHALRSKVSVTKKEVVRYFRAQEKNGAWKKSPTLRDCYPVIFEEGRKPLRDGVELLLDDRLGLVIKKVGTK